MWVDARMLEEDLERVEVIIVNLNPNQKSCCAIPAKDYNIYIPTVNGVSLYHAQETSDPLWRCLCFQYHPLSMTIRDANQKPLLEFNKPYRCCCPSVLSCCQKEMTVVKIAGEEKKTIGYIQEPFLGGFCKPKLRIYREKYGRPIGNFRGPCLFIGGCLCASDARINSMDNREIVSVKKGGTISDIEVRSFVDPLLSYDDKLTFLATLLFSDSLFYPGESHEGYTGRNVCQCFPPEISCKLCGVFCCGITFPVMLSCCAQNTPPEGR